MKKHLFGALVVAMPLAAMAAPENYTLDPYHTYSYFEIDHLGVSTIRGSFNKMGGKFTIDHAAKSASVDLAVETASVTTGDVERGSRPRTRDEHLRTADFFNVAEFPRLTYKSTGVKFAGDNPAEITGTLTMMGIAKPVTLKIERWVCKDHPVSKKSMCGGNASGTLKRSDFGMKYGIPAIGDELKLYFGFEAYRD
ncbi:MAG: YceI family protein [Betaproteobacteria bacterium]